MKPIAGYLLFLIGSFALIIGMFAFPAYQAYTGALVILLYVVGLFYAFGNAIRQTKKMGETEKEEEAPKPQQEQQI